MNWAQLKEKRKELRIFLEAHINIIKKTKEIYSIKGGLINISPHGIQIISPTLIEPTEDVIINFRLKETNELISNTGQVKWCFKINDKYKIGIQLYKENYFFLSLKNIISIFDQWSNIDSQEKKTASNYKEAYQLFYSELYWGMFFWIFADRLQLKFSRSAYENDLNIFYFEKILHEIQDTALNDKLKCKSYDIFYTLNKFDTLFIKMGKIFKIIKESYRLEIDQKYPKLIELNYLMNSRIQAFKNKLESLMIPYTGEISFKENNLPLVLASSNNIANGIDFLLLYSYQSLFFKNAKKININICTKDKSILIEIINDGSKMLNLDSITITPHQSLNFHTYHFLDRKHIAWLQYSINFFKEVKAKLTILSESGNNIISLSLPNPN